VELLDVEGDLELVEAVFDEQPGFVVGA